MPLSAAAERRQSAPHTRLLCSWFMRVPNVIATVQVFQLAQVITLQEDAMHFCALATQFWPLHCLLLAWLHWTFHYLMPHVNCKSATVPSFYGCHFMHCALRLLFTEHDYWVSLSISWITRSYFIIYRLITIWQFHSVFLHRCSFLLTTHAIRLPY